jgi:hypothetical protein
MMNTRGMIVPIAAFAPIDSPPPLLSVFDDPDAVLDGELTDALADPTSLA